MASSAASPTGATCLVLLAMLGMAVREDLLHHRISNRLNVAGLLLGLGLAVVTGGLGAAASAVAGALVGGAAFMPFYLLHGMGAGDVKLMAAAGTFLGPTGALLAAALALVAGAALALALVAWRLLEPGPGTDAADAKQGVALKAAVTLSTVRKERFPYAVAVAAGVVAVLWQRGSLALLWPL